MEKSPDAFRTISEVADWLGVQAHVLRFWESKFSQVKPVKRAGGRRYYRPSDMQLLGGIKKLLHDDGLTIKGVQKILREQGIGNVSSQSKSLESLTGEDAAAEAARDVTPSEPDATVLQFRGAGGRAASKPRAVPTEAPQEDSDVADEKPGSFEPEEPEQEAPVLPSFLHRPSEPVGVSDEPEPSEPQEPDAAEVAAAMVVDAPDPPPEDEIKVAPGVLARLARVDHLTAEQARQIAPIADELRAIVNRAGS